MKRPHLLIGALVLAALVALGVVLWPKLFRKVTEEVPLPPTGEAAYNSLYALKMALRAHGEQVSTWPNVASAMRHLQARDTLLVYDRPEAMSQAQAQHLVDWVRGGGHLLMPGPPGSGSPGPLASAFGLRVPKAPKADFDEEDADAVDPDGGCERLSLDGRAASKENRGTWLCDERFVPTLDGYQLGAGDETKGYRFARRGFGDGMVTVVELSYLDNEGLRDPAARAMAYQVLAPSLGRKSHLQLVYSADVPSLFRLLVDHAWMVLLPLLLALVAWLAWRGQRFGPLQPVPEPRRRALLEHVRAAGEFAWKRQRASALHAAVLRLLQQRLQRRAPEIFALSGAAQEQALADATSLPVNRVREALRPQGLQHPATFTQSIATLLQMRSRL